MISPTTGPMNDFRPTSPDMNQLTLAPYYHPTTICFVDDNEPFLASLELELPGDWACRTFCDPEEALAYLNEPIALEPLMDRCFSLQRDSHQAVIHLDLSLIEQEISHVDRFRRNSVLVVDYAMPSITGLQFCAALKDTHIRRAMLTGVADEKLAVQAFNAGLIHRFIPKQKDDPILSVHRFVEELVQEYFNQYTERLKSALAIDPPPFLTDPIVASWVHELMQEHRLVEYYLVGDPPGFLMLKSNGEIWRLAILSPADVAEQARLARGFGAPQDLVNALTAGDKAVFLAGLSPEDYFGDEDFPWAELTHDASRLANEWTVAIWRDAPADIDFDPAVASYDAYRSTL
ncbi:MAG: response regulator [Gammaproteobacteria bacterium]|nr:MAG: response regulator [Gammaproteobacteria bacterium]